MKKDRRARSYTLTSIFQPLAIRFPSWYYTLERVRLRRGVELGKSFPSPDFRTLVFRFWENHVLSSAGKMLSGLANNRPDLSGRMNRHDMQGQSFRLEMHSAAGTRFLNWKGLPRIPRNRSRMPAEYSKSIPKGKVAKIEQKPVNAVGATSIFLTSENESFRNVDFFAL
jgi:hypothetical protein